MQIKETFYLSHYRIFKMRCRTTRQRQQDGERWNLKVEKMQLYLVLQHMELHFNSKANETAKLPYIRSLIRSQQAVSSMAPISSSLIHISQNSGVCHRRNFWIQASTYTRVAHGISFLLRLPWGQSHFGWEVYWNGFYYLFYPSIFLSVRQSSSPWLVSRGMSFVYYQ